MLGIVAGKVVNLAGSGGSGMSRLYVLGFSVIMNVFRLFTQLSLPREPSIHGPSETQRHEMARWEGALEVTASYLLNHPF